MLMQIHITLKATLVLPIHSLRMTTHMEMPHMAMAQLLMATQRKVTTKSEVIRLVVADMARTPCPTLQRVLSQ